MVAGPPDGALTREPDSIPASRHFTDYRHSEDFRGASQVATWLARIVINHALMPSTMKAILRVE
jgi:hypothetical protein